MPVDRLCDYDTQAEQPCQSHFGSIEIERLGLEQK